MSILNMSRIETTFEEMNKQNSNYKSGSPPKSLCLSVPTRLCRVFHPGKGVKITFSSSKHFSNTSRHSIQVVRILVYIIDLHTQSAKSVESCSSFAFDSVLGRWHKLELFRKLPNGSREAFPGLPLPPRVARKQNTRAFALAVSS